MKSTQTKNSLSLITLVGLTLSLIAPVIYSVLIGPLLLKPRMSGLTYSLIGFAVFWVLALAVLSFNRRLEKQTLTAVGWLDLSWKQALGAVVIGLLLSLLVPLLSLLVSSLVPASQTGSIAEVTTTYPWWVILLSVITAGITEEILFRGYPIERLLAGNYSIWLSGGLSLIFFVAIHASGWNLAHIIGVVLPLGLALTGLYLWQRNLLFVIIVHLMIDLPLVFLTLWT